MIFKLRYKKLGGHIHVRFFSAPTENQTFGKNGDLTFREDEWEPFLCCFSDYKGNRILILPEDSLP